jgi:hypothetical protein
VLTHYNLERASVMRLFIAAVPAFASITVDPPDREGYTFSLVVQYPAPRPGTYSGDDVDHDSVSELLKGIPTTAPDWGVPYMVSRFQTASQLAWNSLPLTPLVEKLEECYHTGVAKSLRCYQAVSMYALLISEFASRPTRLGEEEFILPDSRRLCASIANADYQDWVRDGLRKFVHDRESGMVDFGMSSIERFPLANINYVCNLEGLDDLISYVVYHRIYRHVYERMHSGSPPLVNDISGISSLSDELDRISQLFPSDVLLSGRLTSTFGGSGGRLGHRSWLTELFRVMSIGKFFLDTYEELDNPELSSNPAYESRFRVIGRLMALSLVDHIPCRMRSSFVKLLFHGRDALSNDGIGKWSELVTGDNVFHRDMPLNAMIDGFYELIPEGAFRQLINSRVLTRWMCGRRGVVPETALKNFWFAFPTSARISRKYAAQIGQWFRYFYMAHFSSDMDRTEVFETLTGIHTMPWTTIPSVKILPAPFGYWVESDPNIQLVQVPVFTSYDAFRIGIGKPLYWLALGDNPAVPPIPTIEPYLFKNDEMPPRSESSEWTVPSECQVRGSEACFAWLIAQIGRHDHVEGRLCRLLADPEIVVRIRGEIRETMLLRDFRSFGGEVLQEENHFPLVDLPSYCAVSQVETRMAVLYHRLLEHVHITDRPMTIVESVRELAEINCERSPNGVFKMRTRWSEFAAFSNDGPRQLGKWLATALVNQVPTGLEFNHGFYKVLIHGRIDELTSIWTERDLELEDDAAFREYQRRRDMMGDVKFVSLHDEPIELIHDGANIMVTERSAELWQQLIISDFMFRQYAGIFQDILEGFQEVVKEPVFDNIVSVDDIRALIRGVDEISTDELLSRMRIDDERIAKWLTDAFEERGNEFRMNFFKRVTMLPKVPVTRFSKLIVVTRSAECETLTIDSSGLRVEVPVRVNSAATFVYELESAMQGADHIRHPAVRLIPYEFRQDDITMAESQCGYFETDEASSERAFTTAAGNDILHHDFFQKVRSCVSSNRHTWSHCHADAIKLTELVAELLSRKTKSGAIPFSLDGATESLLNRIWNDPLMTEYVIFETGKLTFNRFSEFSTLPSSMDKYPLVKLPFAVDLKHQLELRIAVLYQRVYQHVSGQPRSPLSWLTAELGTVFRNGVFFVASDNGIMGIDSKIYNLPGHAEHCHAIGRLLAIAVIERTPIGIQLEYALLKLIIHGKKENRDRIWRSEDLKRANSKINEKYQNIIRSVVSGDPQSSRSLSDDRFLAGIEPKLTRNNLPLWQQLATIDYVYSRNKIGYDAIVDGFYGILPDGVFDNLLTVDELGMLLRGGGDGRVSSSKYIPRMERRILEFGFQDSLDHNSIPLITEPDLVSIGTALMRLVVSSAIAFERLGGYILLSRVAAFSEMKTLELVRCFFLLGELASRPPAQGLEPLNEELLTYVRIMVCRRLLHPDFLSYLLGDLNQRKSFRQIYGGVFRTQGGNVLSDHPLANLPCVCDIPDNRIIRETIVDHRIGRHLQVYQFVSRGVLHIPYDFSIYHILDLIDETPTGEFANGVVIRYPPGESSAVGVGVYRDWFNRVFEKLLLAPTAGFFVHDASAGVYRFDRGAVNRFGGPSHETIGKLLAISVLDSLPIGKPFNHGLYRFLVDGEQVQWSSDDLERDDPEAFRAWRRTVFACNAGDTHMLTFVSLGGEDVLVVGGEDIDLTPETCNDWATAALHYHMYGQYQLAYDMVRRGFISIVGDRVFDHAMDLDDVKRVIEGIQLVSTGELMREMSILDFGEDTDKVRSWMMEVLEEGGNEFRSDFLRFVTGFKSMPTGGFTAAQHHHITIKNAVDLTVDSLPRSHTCFLTLDLPLYPSREILRSKLEIAVKETYLVQE